MCANLNLYRAKLFWSTPSKLPGAKCGETATHHFSSDTFNGLIFCSEYYNRQYFYNSVTFADRRREEAGEKGQGGSRSANKSVLEDPQATTELREFFRALPGPHTQDQLQEPEVDGERRCKRGKLARIAIKAKGH